MSLPFGPTGGGSLISKGSALRLRPALVNVKEVRLRLSTYRGTSLIRNCHSLGPYSRPIPRALRWSWGWGCAPPSSMPRRSTSIFFSHKVFVKSFCKGQFSHKFVNL